MLKLVTEAGVEWNLFSIDIVPEGHSSFASDISFYVTADRADFDAKRLSKAFPTANIKLTLMARVKARYLNGERVQLNDYKDFYDNLTEEQYKATKIQDSVTAEFI